MHTHRAVTARSFVRWLAPLACLVVLSGCASLELTDLTSSSLPENPSEIYTFTLRVTPKTNEVDRQSIAPHIVVDGQDYAMKKSSIAPDIWEFEYQLPAGRTDVAYYYLVNYAVSGPNMSTPQQKYTGVTHAQIVRREVLQMAAYRGPVGANIGILGRGFTSQDAVCFDGTPVRTEYASPDALSFFVPPLETGRSYQVSLSSPAGNSPVGTFRIDPTSVTVSPPSLALTTGDRQSLSFTLSLPAPPGGLLLDLTTDIPESVIMPEVVVPEGQTTVSVDVEGGRPGAGTLLLKGYGGGDVSIPVTVTGK